MNRAPRGDSKMLRILTTWQMSFPIVRFSGNLLMALCAAMRLCVRSAGGGGVGVVVPRVDEKLRLQQVGHTLAASCIDVVYVSRAAPTKARRYRLKRVMILMKVLQQDCFLICMIGSIIERQYAKTWYTSHTPCHIFRLPTL